MLTKHPLCLIKPPADLSIVGKDTMQTEIDGCSITMHFAPTANETAMEQVKGTLKAAYLRSISK